MRMDDQGAVQFAHPRGRPLHECPSPPPMGPDPARELVAALEDAGILMDLRYVMECLWRPPPHLEAVVARERESSRAA